MDTRRIARGWAVKPRTDCSAAALRWPSRTCEDVDRRLLLLAAVLDRKNRTYAARMGGGDEQSLCDWGEPVNQDSARWAPGYLA